MKQKIITNLKELRKPSEIITDFAESLDIIKDLEDSLNLDKGIGLSAIQIGINKRIGIIRYGEKKINLINPVIIEKYDKFMMKNEGCLSLPGIFVNTIRYKEITIENNGKVFCFDIENDKLIPIAILHEIEHMNGRLIIDNKWRKR